MARILVIDPDPEFQQQLAVWLQRFGDHVLWASSLRDAREGLKTQPADLILVDEKEAPLGMGLHALHVEELKKPPPVALICETPDPMQLIASARQAVKYHLIKPAHPRELIASIHAWLRGQRRFVCLGGGTGLYNLLLSLKQLPNMHLTSIVTMSDDGGSTGRIRESFGLLPPGDVRRSLVALSTAPMVLQELMEYRFETGDGLKEHNLGNLLLTAMANLRGGSMAESVRAIGDVLNIQGTVIPVTETLNTLIADMEDGTTVRGEHYIDVPAKRNPHLRIKRLWQEPEAVATADAIAALLSADVITIGPGDLYTSILATLIVDGIGEAICASQARKLYVCNLMTKPGETGHFTVADHICEIVRYLGEDALHDVLVSNTKLSEDAIANYAKNGQEPIKLDEGEVIKQVTQARIRVCDIGSEHELVRHDLDRLGFQIIRAITDPSFQPPTDGND